MTNSSTFADVLAETRGVLEELGRSVAALGELPGEAMVAADLEDWADQLTVREAAPPPVVGWFLRG